jgi:hypothetical protein
MILANNGEMKSRANVVRTGEWVALKLRRL